ncbi:MAG: orotidine-5'-phosphate decarboxylase [Tissierellia bacterium]|nr:orotidine-5'-phosphate decarboxylase [Tissierellia bacterium]
MGKDVIIALDFNSMTEALDFLSPFEEALFLKVGMELYYKEGPEIVRQLKKRGHKIFLDLKLHDIPNTVKKATISMLDLKVDMINYHIPGGRKMLEEATQVVKKRNPKMITLGITMLTSTDEEMMKNEILLRCQTVEDAVLSYAKLGQKAGLSGVVCSALEVPRIKKELGENFLTVTPGIRREITSHDDQKRVVTPRQAGELGSDYIVVGRPITQSENPYGSYHDIKNEFLGV